MLMKHTRVVAVILAAGLVLAGCESGGPGGATDEPRAGYGGMGIAPPTSTDRASWLGPDTFPCRPTTGDESYVRYGVGPMRRGGFEAEELERDHIVIDGEGVNFHGIGRVADGGTIEMEMDDDYFEPTVLKGPPGGTVTIDLRNEGLHPHNFSVPSQRIDLNCGVRAHGEVEVAFPRSGVLIFSCKYTATSGMRGALAVKGTDVRR
jgi:plastocyanin